MDEDKNLQPVQPDESTEPELDENGNPIIDMTDQDVADVAPTAGETIKLKADHSKTLELKTVEDVMEYSYLRYSMSVIIRILSNPSFSIQHYSQLVEYKLNDKRTYNQ